MFIVFFCFFLLQYIFKDSALSSTANLVHRNPFFSWCEHLCCLCYVLFVFFFLSWFTRFAHDKAASYVRNKDNPVPLLFSFQWNEWRPTLSKGMTLLCQLLLSSYSQTRSWTMYVVSCPGLNFFLFLSVSSQTHMFLKCLSTELSSKVDMSNV